MRVVLFIDSLHGGGAQRQMAIMANLFSKYGHNVSLVTFKDFPDDYEVASTVNRVRLGAKCGKLRRWLQIVGYFQKEQYDIVISFIANEISIMSTFYLPRRENFVVVAGERTFSESGERLQILKKRMKYYKWADYVVANSSAQTEQMTRLRPQWKEKFLTIGNYIDVSSFLVSSLPSGQVIKIGIYSRYHPVKNGKRLIEAIRMLRNQGQYNFRFYWFGHVQKQRKNSEYEKLKQLIEEFDLKELIVLCDRVYDVNASIQEMDAVCLPSETEGFANAIAEGICCGRPILASRISDNPLMVEEGVNGFLFNPLDVNEIADKIRQLLSLDKSTMQRMGENSRKKALSLFDEAEFVNHYLSLAHSKI